MEKHFRKKHAAPTVPACIRVILQLAAKLVSQPLSSVRVKPLCTEGAPQRNEKNKDLCTHTRKACAHTQRDTNTHTPAQTHRHPHTQTKTTTHSKANSFLCREPAMRVSERVHPTADTCTTQNVQQAPKICKLHTVAACNNPPTRPHRVNDIVIVYSMHTPTQIQPASHLLCLFQAQVITSLSASGPVTLRLIGSSSLSGSKRGYHTLAISTDMQKIGGTIPASPHALPPFWHKGV